MRLLKGYSYGFGLETPSLNVKCTRFSSLYREFLHAMISHLFTSRSTGTVRCPENHSSSIFQPLILRNDYSNVLTCWTLLAP